jgi:hypothetical protein
MSDFYKHLDAIRKIADETFQPAEAKAKPDFLDLDKDSDKTEPMKQAAKDTAVKENPEMDYEGSLDFEFTGDDGETAMGTLHYKAVNGVVDPNSLRGESEYEGNAKVDDEFATIMVQPGGGDHEAALDAAQDDYDYEAQRMRSKFGEDETVADEGAFKEMDTVKKEKARLYAKLKDLKAKYNAQMAGQWDGEPEDTEEEIEKIEKELGMSQESINTEAMDKKTVNEAITMTAETPEEASVLMQILKLAGVTPVTQDMINQPEAEKSQEQPVGPQTAGDQMRATMDKVADEEFANEPDVDYQSTNDLVNTHSGGLNRQKVQVKKGYPGDNDLAEVNQLEQLANKLREEYNALYKPVTEAHGKATCGCDEDSCSHCKGYHGLDEVGKKCECCGNEIEAVKTEAKNPYAVGMAQAMKSTGDTPPLEKSTIKKAHDIAKAVAKNN